MGLIDYVSPFVKGFQKISKQIVPGILSGIKYITSNSGRIIGEIGKGTLSNLKSSYGFLKNIYSGRDAFYKEDNEIFDGHNFRKRDDIEQEQRLVKEAYRRGMSID